MTRKIGGVCALATLIAVVALGGSRADVIVADGVKAGEYKGAGIDLKEGEKGTLKLSFKAGKKVTVTVKSEKKSDVNLMVYDADKKEIAKDDSPGPDCKLTFTPEKDGELTIVVLNKGPGANRSTVKVDIAKDAAKDKAKDKAKDATKDSK
jgi:hypothetical protein